MKKIFPTILFLFIIISLFTIPTIKNKNTLRTNFEIEEKTTTNKVYLLDKNNYLVKVDVFLPKEEIIKNIIYYLKEDNKEEDWNGYLPKELKVLDYELENKELIIHFSSEIKEVEENNLSGLIHSLLELKEVEKVKILDENNPVGGYEDFLDESFPINKINETTSRKDIQKVILYYVESIENENLVPVTKYLNQKNNKIEVILEELKNNIPSPLISYIPTNLELIEYEIQPDAIVLNFSKELIKDSNKQEIILKEISETLFDNYEVSSILYKVEGKPLEIHTKND